MNTLHQLAFTTLDWLSDDDPHVPQPSLGESMQGLPALSIRQPWAWAILHAGKDIENRSWPTRFRGRFLIHAAKGCTRAEYIDACAFMAGFCGGVDVPPLDALPKGGIVGVASLVGCVSESVSDWFVGDWGFELNDVQELEFTPCKGALGFFAPKLSADTQTEDKS